MFDHGTRACGGRLGHFISSAVEKPSDPIPTTADGRHPPFGTVMINWGRLKSLSSGISCRPVDIGFNLQTMNQIGDHVMIQNFRVRRGQEWCKGIG
jgi:hypothetical protein